MASWPAWVRVWAGVTTLLFLLRAGGAIRSVPLCIFLSSVAGALSFGIDQLRATGEAHPLLRFRQAVVVVVVVVVPCLFDPSTTEVDNLPRLVILLVAAALVVGDWAVDAAWSGWRPRRLVNGLQWVLLATVVWFGVTTLTSVEPRQSLLGRYGTYEGFVLIVALAVLASALAESFRADALPALCRIVVAAAVPVLVYGGIQFYGFVVRTNATWDFVRWHNEYRNVFATFGNPNHLGGYLVTVLPFGVVAAVLAVDRRWRLVLWGWVAVTVLLVVQTGARGAWLGALAGGAVLGVGLFPKLRASVGRVAIGVGVAAVAVVALVASGRHFLGAKATDLFRFGSGSSVSQRDEIWSAALRLASHNLLVGTGPDTFAATYTRYAGAGLAKLLGNAIYVNGAHDIFLSWLVNEGVPGLVLIVALFGLGVAWGVRTWRSLGVGAPDAEVTGGARRAQGDVDRYLVAALVAALVAYFVQASFDVEQVGTLFVVFMVVGLLGVANRSVWPVATLLGSPVRVRPRDADASGAEQDPGYGGLPAPARARRRSSRAQREDRRLVAAVVAGILGLSAVALVFWRADALWRADHQELIGTQAALERATELNPWEPTYFEAIGDLAFATYAHFPKDPTAPVVLRAAVSYLGQGAALDGDSTTVEMQYGTALQAQAELEPSDTTSARLALAAYRRAQQDDPRNAQLPGLIAQVQRMLRHET